MKRLFIVLFLVFSLMGCTAASNGTKLEIEEVEEFRRINIEPLEETREFVYILDEGVPFTAEDGTNIREFYKHERVGIIRQDGPLLYVEDRTGVKGTVNESFTQRNIEVNVAVPIEDVDYSANPQKDVPLKDYFKVRGVYLPPNGVNNIDEFLAALEDTAINTIVLDYKRDNGEILFDSAVANEIVPKANTKIILDGEAFIKKIKDKGFHLIARIVAFKSPIYAETYPNRSILDGQKNAYYMDGSYWSTPYDKRIWQYLYDLSREAIEYGFDEIQYDYVRFPVVEDPDVDLQNNDNISMTKAIQDFLIGAKLALRDLHVVISADVFGWSTSALDDVGIGQQWEAISTSVDVISPMIYPSHYNAGIYGLDNPNAHPYKLVKGAMSDALQRDMGIETPAISRPWVQDFTWGDPPYTATHVAEQVRALNELGIGEYILWNAWGSYQLSELEE